MAQLVFLRLSVPRRRECSSSSSSGESGRGGAEMESMAASLAQESEAAVRSLQRREEMSVRREGRCFVLIRSDVCEKSCALPQK